MNEFLHGSVWVCTSDGIALCRYQPIDNDPVISALNSEAMEMFAGCYEFDSHGMPCWFNHIKEKQEAPKMLGIIQKITDRLNEINDATHSLLRIARPKG